MILTNMKINGNLKLDFFHLEEESSNNSNIFTSQRYIPSLNNDSRFLVTFDDTTLIARGIIESALGNTFSVYRELKDSNNLEFVSKIDEGTLSIVDYNILNNTYYRYYIFKEDESAISAVVSSNEVEPCWWDWSLTDLVTDNINEETYYADPNNIWKFSLNIQTNETSQNFNKTVYNNLTQFPKVSTGKLNYAKGSLTALLGRVDNINSVKLDYIEESELLQKWNAFCANGNIKLLKDRKGNSMLVDIESSSSQLIDETMQQATNVTFNWVQVGTTDEIIIIEK